MLDWVWVFLVTRFWPFKHGNPVALSLSLSLLRQAMCSCFFESIFYGMKEKKN